MTKIPEETLAHWERERARQRQRRDAMNEWGAKGKNEWGRTSMNEWGDKAPAELVTEEMVEEAMRANEEAGGVPTFRAMAAALRAVAPLIAAAAVEQERVRRRAARKIIPTRQAP